MKRTPPVATPSSGSKGGGAAVGWSIVGLVVIGLVALGRNGGTPASNATSADQANVAQAAISERLTEAPRAPVEPLDVAAVRRGRGHLRMAAVEGLSGEMVYSQNCWDGLTRRFSWSQLDVCGAFDAAAGAALGDDTAAALDREVAWFDGEAGAGRYLKAAVAAGAAADEADRRLESLQARFPRRRDATAATPNGVPEPPAVSETSPVDGPGGRASG